MDASQRFARQARDTRESAERAGDLHARIDQLLEWQAWQSACSRRSVQSNDESSSQRGTAFFDTLTARLAVVLGADRGLSWANWVWTVPAWTLSQSSVTQARQAVLVFPGRNPLRPGDREPCVRTQQDVVRLFPEDTLLAEMGIHAYVGVPLRGRPTAEASVSWWACFAATWTTWSWPNRCCCSSRRGWR